MISADHFYLQPGFKPQKKFAVFLDRDGVINQEKHLVHQKKDFILIPGVATAIKKLNRKNIPVIVIHNAAVVYRGISTPEKVDQLNRYMILLLKKQQAQVNAVLFCGHHPSAFAADFLKDCNWHKPKPGMLQTAAKKLNLNLTQSFVIGDQARDILAGQAAGATSILVTTGRAGKDLVYQATPDKTFTHLESAINWIIKLKKLK